MLTYFPTPYPDEWWYSILCRYHVRSGNAKHQSTVKELFEGKATAAMGSVFPNGTIRQVTSQLPPSFLTAKEVILRHTLFPYYMRFYRQEEKEKVLERLCMGETVVITSIRLFADASKWSPRYCPRCAETDRAAYGEAYWHMEHQIPMMTLCPIHRCRLLPIPSLPVSHLSYTFFPLDAFDLSSEYEEQDASPLPQILYDYYALPLSSGVTEGYSNLAIALGNMGYEVIQNHSKHTILDAKRLYQDLIRFYGKPLVEQVFGGEQSICTINRICKWEMKAPERYALLQCFAGLDSKVVFGCQPLRSRYEEELHALQKTGVVYGKKQLAERLGVTVSQLDALAKKHSIQPFWTQNGGGETERLRKIRFTLEEQDLLLFKQALETSGYRYDSHFARHCILKHIEEHYISQF